MTKQVQKRLLTSLLISFLSLQCIYAQVITQTVRGTVTDNILQNPLTGATVSLPLYNKTVVTDSLGHFRFRDVPVGVQLVFVSYIGYKDAVAANIVVNAGKEVVLNITLEENPHKEEEVILKSNSRRNKPLNEMSLVSARAFTVEETQKYAAAVNDPLRMATNFAGVASADDGNNEIVIRGNAPNGLLWRMEGIDIPNPNHFGMEGSSGGGISILSAQLLSNSDFVTGAFASEYGNALSGVFDLKLRKGNDEKKEYALQAGLLGLNAAAEGPFSTKGKGSYLLNYRYSTLNLLNKLGLDLGAEASTNFQDLSWNIQLPTKRMGSFGFFGFGGLSSQKKDPAKDSSKWEFESDRYGGSYYANTGVAGITHNIAVGRRSGLKSALAMSVNETGYNEKYVERSYDYSNTYKDVYETRKITLSSVFNHKINARNNIRAGGILNLIHFNYYRRSRENVNAPVKEVINSKGQTQTVQAYAQWQSKPIDKLTITVGFHFLTLLLNNSYSIEPRISARWDANKNNSISFGYGLHSQVQSLGIYYAENNNAGIKTMPNKNLGFSKSSHYVLSYNHAFSRNLKLKTEIYYQSLNNIPVSIYDSSTFSTLNVQGGYFIDPLTNKGKGKNYGLEISIEKNLSNNFYLMFSNSFYQSKYSALDGIERNTKYNGNYISNFVAGKEFISASRRRTFGINIKAVYAGGYRTTPIDFEKSNIEGYTIYREKEAYSLQNPAYFRTDIRLSMKWNKKALTSTLSLDIQNVANHLNVYDQTYDPLRKKIITNYQAGIIPILNYKIEW